jgi:hypothetical protein
MEPSGVGANPYPALVADEADCVDSRTRDLRVKFYDRGAEFQSSKPLEDTNCQEVHLNTASLGKSHEFREADAEHMRLPLR